MVNILTKKLMRKFLKYDNEQLMYDKEVYEFGTTLLINKILFAVIIIGIGIVLKSLLLSIVFLVVFPLVRKYGGGLHFDNQTLCFVFSIMIALFSIILSKQNFFSYNFPAMLCCDCIIMFLCPIEAINKPLSSAEKHFYKKKYWNIIIMINVVIFICIYIKLFPITRMLQLVIYMDTLLVVFGWIYNRYKIEDI